MLYCCSVVKCSAEAATIRNDLKAQKRKCLKEKGEAVRNKASDNMKLAMDLAKEKGASSWLSVLPIDEFGFFLHKGAFRDAVALRYGWQLPNLLGRGGGVVVRTKVLTMPSPVPPVDYQR